MSKKYPLVSSLVRPLVSAVRCGLSEIVGGGQWWNAEWTNNYNGVNSYVEIPVWVSTGTWELEFDYYNAEAQSVVLLEGRQLMGDSADVGRLYINNSSENVTHSFSKASGDTIVIGGGKLGWQHIKLTNLFAGKQIRMLGNRVDLTQSFKGQISNLKLIDHENPKNSRFYRGIIRAYVDPDAVDVPMPDSTVLVDEWCVGEDMIVNTADKGGWTVSNGVYTRSDVAGWDNYSIVHGSQFTSTSVVTMIFTNMLDTPARVYVYSGASFIHGSSIDFGRGEHTVSIRVPSEGYFGFDMNGGVIKVGNIKVTKVTHGICTNFGTDQPYVPLLGEREEYCGSRKDGAYIRGVDAPESRMSSYGGPTSPGSVSGSFTGDIPVATSILVAGNSRVESLGPDAGSKFTVATKGELTNAFQYPNTFKVIKPTDPDYPDYLAKLEAD